MTIETNRNITPSDALEMARYALLVRADQWEDAAKIECVDLEEVWQSDEAEQMNMANTLREAMSVLEGADLSFDQYAVDHRHETGFVDALSMAKEALCVRADQWREAAESNDVSLAEIWESKKDERESMARRLRRAYLDLGGQA